MSEEADQPTLAPSDDDAMFKLLDEPFVFTQRAALTVDAFGKELRERKVAWPEHGQLEAFHRAGLLVPIYSIRYDPQLGKARAKAEGRKISRDDMRGLLDFTNTYGYGLINEREVGDLGSPIADGYEPLAAAASQLCWPSLSDATVRSSRGRIE